MNLTEKERAMLADIIGSEYQDGNPVDHDIWLDYVTGSKSRGGVLSSLQSKGFVRLHIVPMAKSDNRQNGITDSTVAITQAGFDAFNAAKATPEILKAIREVEAAHFRTVEDTGANKTALLVWNALRSRLGLPRVWTEDLPAWDEQRKGYYMPVNSKLLTAPEALARGGKV